MNRIFSAARQRSCSMLNLWHQPLPHTSYCIVIVLTIGYTATELAHRQIQICMWRVSTMSLRLRICTHSIDAIDSARTVVILALRRERRCFSSNPFSLAERNLTAEQNRMSKMAGAYFFLDDSFVKRLYRDKKAQVTSFLVGRRL